MKAKKNTWLWVVIIILSCIFLAPTVVKWVKKDNKTNIPQNTESYLLLDVYSAEMDFAEGRMSIDLIEGVIKTNEQVDKIFVNINGIGTQYIDFDANLIRTDEGQYIAHYMSGVKNICATAFASDGIVTVDTYIEYAGRSYKVDTQKLSVKSAWTNNY